MYFSYMHVLINDLCFDKRSWKALSFKICLMILYFHFRIQRYFCAFLAASGHTAVFENAGERVRISRIQDTVDFFTPNREGHSVFGKLRYDSNGVISSTQAINDVKKEVCFSATKQSTRRNIYCHAFSIMAKYFLKNTV